MRYCNSFSLNQKNIDGLKEVIQSIRDELLQDLIDKAVLNFVKRLRDGEHVSQLMVDTLNMLRCFELL